MGVGKTGRLMSLDALRGFDMIWIMGLASFFSALGVCIGGSFGLALQTQMTHCEWEGLRLYDLIFPTFLFLSGVTWPFSYASMEAKGRPRAEVFRKILVRMVLLILLGWVHDDILKLDFAHQRVWSVIGRIGIAWAVSAFVYVLWGVRGLIVSCAAILAGYFALIKFVHAPGVPDGVDFLSQRTYCIAHWVDSNYLTLCKRSEGGFATLGMPPTAMLGVLTGVFLRRTDLTGARKTLLMLAGAVALALAGFAWQPWCPCVKSIWTPTYVFFAGAIALAFLAVFYWIIDVKGWRKWSFFFMVIGMNSITIYIAQHFIKFKAMSELVFGGVASFLPEAVAVVVLAGGVVLLRWLFLFFLYRKNTFLKI